MTPKKVEKTGSSFPLQAAFYMAILGAVVVGFSFEVIKYYPLPASVDPYFDGWTGSIWGAIVGAISGLVLGYLTDDNHFQAN
jgi:hypothetical protein